MQTDKLEDKMAQLKEYFMTKPEVVMAFLFGSCAKGQAISESDVDVAVYFKPAGREIEWEETRTYESEDRMWSDVEKIVGKRTDFVVLNRASVSVADSIIREGIPIIVKDQPLFARFFLLISAAAEDFREFVRDFWALKERSSSLSETDQMRLTQAVDFLEKELADYASFVGVHQREYETETVTRRNMERWVENIVNASIDIAKIVLAAEKRRIPSTYREILQGLFLLEGFDAKTAEKLAQFSRLRNVLAHEYLDIRWQQIRAFVLESESAYRGLVSYVKKILQ